MPGTSLKWCKACKENFRTLGFYKKCERCKQTNSESWFRLQYAITLAQRKDMLEEQNYKCEICKRPANAFQKGLHVDHCHETNKVRGMLCAKCNAALGYIEKYIKDKDFSLRVDAYLTKVVRKPDVPELNKEGKIIVRL